MTEQEELDAHRLTERIKLELMRQREDMRRARYDHEFHTIYDSNVCPICHHRHMTGIVCRRHRGSVCERHCTACEYHEPEFGHCIYKERRPADMRKWRLVYGCKEKDELWRGLWWRKVRSGGSLMEQATPKYIVLDTPDEKGDYSIVDPDTGEIQGVVAKFLPGCGVWVCVEYLQAEE